MTFAELTAFVRRGAAFAIAVAVLAGAAAFLVTRQQSPIYRASAALVASQPASSYAGPNVIAPPAVDAGVYQAALLEGPVVSDALTAVEGVRPDDRRVKDFKKHLSVRVEKKDLSSVIRIEVESSDPAFAAAAVNALADALIAWDRDRARLAFERSIAAIERSIQAIDAELATAGQANRQELQALRAQRENELGAARERSDASVFVGLLEPLAVATPPTEAVGPRVVFRTFVAAFLGLVGAFGLLFVRWSTNPRLRGRADLALAGALPVLAEFPRPSRDEGGLSREAGNFLRANVLAASEYQAPLVVAVASAEAAGEKAGVALSLAGSFARAGNRVLLVDGDLRSQTAAERDTPSVAAPTLEAHLEDPYEDFAPASVTVDQRHTLDIVPGSAAASHPLELIGRGFAHKLEAWRQNYDCIVIDMPPLLPFADTFTMAPLCSGLVLCAGVGRSRRDRLQESVGLLRESDIRFLGAVIVDVPRARRHARYGSIAEESESAQPQQGEGRGRQRGSGAMTNVQVKRSR